MSEAADSSAGNPAGSSRGSEQDDRADRAPGQPAPAGGDAPDGARPQSGARRRRRRIVVVGGGIVGSALAQQLTKRDHTRVTVVDRSPAGELYGATGHAPGFVGVFHETELLTDLARQSVQRYQAISVEGVRGFERVGSLELAHTEEGAQVLRRRAQAAAAQQVTARLLDPAEAAGLAPRLVDPARTVAALHFPHDGTARAALVTHELRRQAEAAGARFRTGTEVTALDTRDGRISGVHLGEEALEADDVVLACGMWGPALARTAGAELPLTPVLHPYVYGPEHPQPHPAAPFVRWPEHHVYARDHGERDGLGSYDHTPHPVAVGELGERAELPWPGEVFDPAVDAALRLFPPEHAPRPAERLAGLFSMTADGLPLLGGHREVAGLWSAEAVWVTHAAGAAAALAALMYDHAPDERLRALAPDRFAGQSPDDLERRALDGYRDIYATGEARGGAASVAGEPSG